MQRGQRDLARTDEVQVVGGHVVDLLLGVGQHAGAEERLLADEHGRDDGLEPVAPDHVERPAHERQLEQDELATQVREARAGETRAALHVDPLAGQLQVVPRLGHRIDRVAHLADDGVLLRGGRVGEVRERAQELLQPLVRGGGLRCQILDLRREALEVLELLGDVPSLALAGRDLLGGRLLLRPQRLRPRDRRAALTVECQDVVDRVGHAGTAACERRLHAIRILADAPEVQHGS